MWPAYALGSIGAGVLETIVDKIAIVDDSRIDIGVATFWRNALFWFFTVVVGYLGFLGNISIFFDWRIIGFAFMAAASGYFYTYMLKHVEVTGAVVETYLSPIAFLIIDVFVVHAKLAPTEIIGIIILTLGGFAFAVNARSRRVKREYSPLILGIFLFWLLCDATEFYLFKYLHSTSGINEVTFFANAWFYALIVLFIFIALRGKTHLLTGRAVRRYIPTVTVSKLCDTANSLLWMRALSFAAVSQVTALLALEPLLLFGVAVFVQKETHFNIRERVDRKNVSWKLFAATLLCFGMFLVT